MRKNTKFNREQIIDKATNLYWEKGFHATSMRNLQDVIDMRPGSIYAAFGSKEGLFKETLARYTQLGIEHLMQCRSEASSPIEAMKTFIKQLVIEAQTSSPSGICMLVKTVSELTDEQSEILEEAKKSFKTIEREFEKLVIEAQDLGIVNKDKDARQLARHIQIQISGLRTYASVYGVDTALEKMIEDIFTYYPF